MAMSLGGHGGLVSDINVTPMADVMIVLLIIFMVTVPILDERGVRLPPAAHRQEREAEAPAAVTVRADTTTFLDGEELLTPSDLLPRLQDRLARPGAPRFVSVRADQSLPYSELARVLDLCRQAGADQVQLLASSRTGS